jgi:Flp pilus assembly protein TadG
MVKRTRGEQGAAAVEFAIIVSILLMLFTIVAPIVKSGYEYMVLQRAVSHGVRFASRADVNPRVSDSGTLTRRPSVAEVRQFVVAAAQPVGISAANITVTPEPRTAMPGTQVEIEATYTMTYGLLGQIANGLTQLFWGREPAGPAVLSDYEVTVSARGREE